MESSLYKLNTDKNRFDIIVEQEFYNNKDISHINILAAVLMLKDEEKSILITLKSVSAIVSCIIIYDTGSSDNTIELIKNFSNLNKINLYLIKGEFVNFSISRNVLLDYADCINVDYLILLDANDELKGYDILKLQNKNYLNPITTGFLTKQSWFSGDSITEYFNIRFIKNKSGWRYFGSVHEWIKNTSLTNENENSLPVFKILDDIYIYQNRTINTENSGKRFIKDKSLLLDDYNKNPKDTRTLFYLAQTCSCLNQKEESFNYYKERSELEGFQEEKFLSFYKCGNLSHELNRPWSDTMSWYLKAVEHSNRIEPLIKISTYYKNIQNWSLAFTFINLACELQYPKDSILFVDKYMYDYLRWHLMGIIAFYYNKFKEGKEACIKAIQTNINKTLDTNNLQFYLNKEHNTHNNININKKKKKKKK
jgi:hypothetical protein